MAQRSNVSSAVSQAGLFLGLGALVFYGLKKKSKASLALAGLGGIAAFKATQAKSEASEYTAKANFLINTSPEKAYELWRNFENLPRFMSHLKAVKVLDSQRSEWVAIGPGGAEVSWAAEITEDSPGQRIAWRSLPGAAIENHGLVRFETGPVGRGSMVTAEVTYHSPLGALGRGFIALFGKHPDFVVREDVRRFKSLVEAGEAPSTVGQSHGPRGAGGHVKEFLYREISNIPEPQAGQGRKIA